MVKSKHTKHIKMIMFERRSTMKQWQKRISSLLVLVVVLVGFAGCAKSEETNQVIKIGVCAGPYGDMLREAIIPSLELKGYTVEIIEFSDYVQPNIALANGEIDANLFQHTVYLNKFSADNDLEISALIEVPTASMGIFSDVVSDLSDLPEGAVVAVPNDASNLSRALRALQQAGLVTIDPSVDPATATENDLSENPKGLSFVLIEAPQLPRTLESVDAAVITGNYAISAGLNLADAIYNEVLSEGYNNVVAVATENEKTQLAKDLIEAVASDDFKQVIDNPDGQFYAFQRPVNY